MSNEAESSKLFHRSRDRVRVLGEVFTPEAYVESMLNVIAKDSSPTWSDETVTFFEPSCGHGNIVLTIYKKRLEAIYRKSIHQNIKNPALYSVANSINTLWAIDIDAKNIDQTKSRLVLQTIVFLLEKTGNKSAYNLVQKNKDFFSHLLCTLNWQVYENETLSGLSSSSSSKLKAEQTKTGQEWFKRNGHKEIDFEFTWSFYYKELTRDRVDSIEFQRASKYLANLLNGNIRGFEEYSFANSVLSRFLTEGLNKSRAEA